MKKDKEFEKEVANALSNHLAQEFTMLVEWQKKNVKNTLRENVQEFINTRKSLRQNLEQLNTELGVINTVLSDLDFNIAGLDFGLKELTGTNKESIAKAIKQEKKLKIKVKTYKKKK